MGCAASAARREARMGHGVVEQRPGIDGMPIPTQDSELGISGKQRARITEVLRGMPLLAHVNDKDLAEIVRRKLPEPFVVSDGTEILSEGFVPALAGDGPIDGLFVLLGGAAHVVKTFEFGQQGVWSFRVDGQQISHPFFGERVLCGLSGTRAATVTAIGQAEVLNIPRAVWTQIYTRAMGRVAEEQQIVQMQHEYSLLLEGGHKQLADDFGQDLQEFARNKGLPVPDVAELSQPCSRDSRGRRGSVTRIVSRETLRAKKRRASVGEVDLAATEQRTRRQSTADAGTVHRSRRKSVTENLISSTKAAARYQSRAERRKSVSDVAGDRDRDRDQDQDQGRDKARARDKDRSDGSHSHSRRRKSVEGSSSQRRRSSATEQKHSRRRKSVSEGLVEREHGRDKHNGRRRRKSVDKQNLPENLDVALPGHLVESPTEVINGESAASNRIST